MDEYSDYAKRLFEKMERYGIDPDSDHKDQHFMISEDVINAVVDAADVSGGDYVLEIGPGLGQLTEAILEKGAKLVSIEIDPRFKDVLGNIRAKYAGKLNIIWGSALDVRWPDGINKIIMNPPYSILEPLLEIFYAMEDLELISMIIGKKYYENAVQKPGSRIFGKSALMTQAKFNPALIMEIDRDCFYPDAGARSVAMTLSINERPNPILRKLAEFYVNHSTISTKFVVNQALELLNKRARKYRDYEKMITMSQIGISPSILDKRLQDLGNTEISQVVQKLTSHLNYQRKGSGRSDRWREDFR